jgi:D-glycerate 3-kinase
MSRTDPWLSAFLAAERLPPAFAATIDRLYRPLADHIAGAAPRIVGLCGPQGSGKSTGAKVLQQLLTARGLRTAILALDDLYLTRAERAGLAARVHPLFATRGPPGTHDVALGLEVVHDLLHALAALLPAFDKATDDRAPRAAWQRVDGPVDIVLFEGWCVGAVAEPEDALDAPVNRLEAEEDADGLWRRHANAQLAGPYRALFGPIDSLVLIRPPDFAAVADWRLEQEHKLRARIAREGGSGLRVMDDAAVRRFVQYYERTSRHIDREMPARADVVIDLDRQRQPIRMRAK